MVKRIVLTEISGLRRICGILELDAAPAELTMRGDSFKLGRVEPRYVSYVELAATIGNGQTTISNPAEVTP